MGVLNIVLMVLGILGLIEGLIVVFFPKWTVNMGRMIIKDKNKLQKAGMLELTVAILLILISINL